MMALAFSGGKDSMACLHLLRETLDCAIYVDTGVTYPETQALVEYASHLVPFHIVQTDRAGQNAANGIPSDVVPIDWTRLGQEMTGPKPIMIQSYLQCCYENLARPLLEKAKALGVTHLVYGQRNEEDHKSPSRHGDLVEGITRLHPIEDWTTQQVFDYLALHMTVPAHYQIRHSSLDCYDCTAYTKESQDRVAWTQQAHPDYAAAYHQRATALASCLEEALHV